MRAGEKVWSIETKKWERYGMTTPVKPYVGTYKIISVGPYHAIIERKARTTPEETEPGIWSGTGEPPILERIHLSKLFSTRKKAVAELQGLRRTEKEEGIREGDYVACLMPFNKRVVNGLVVRVTAKCAEILMEDGSSTANAFMARRFNKKKLIVLKRNERVPSKRG